ncbi:hypothetical protein [Pseudonocardia spinosispora]|uniref:hypothetical protein n=1 Tax=Pseudonocardia spinosispora TaxID=103441 RepID=UPI00048C35A2|nr:hypothetical protein [Pseudonocardia spinosispora]
MGYDPSFTQRRLAELKAVFEIDNASDVVDPSADQLKQSTATLMDVLWGLRQLSGDLSAHATALATGSNGDPKVAAALPHQDELIENIMAAWSNAAKIHQALQDPSKSKLVDPSEIEDDGGEWVRAD